MRKLCVKSAFQGLNPIFYERRRRDYSMQHPRCPYPDDQRGQNGRRNQAVLRIGMIRFIASSNSRRWGSSNHASFIPECFDRIGKRDPDGLIAHREEGDDKNKTYR